MCINSKELDLGGGSVVLGDGPGGEEAEEEGRQRPQADDAQHLEGDEDGHEGAAPAGELRRRNGPSHGEHQPLDEVSCLAQLVQPVYLRIRG